MPVSDIEEREWIEELIESAVDESSREIAERALRARADESRRDWEADACLRVRESIFTEITTQPHLQMKKDSANV